jgi:hypothetical protein
MDRELSTRNGLFFAIVVWIADLAVEGKGAQNPRESTFRGVVAMFVQLKFRRGASKFGYAR